MRDHDTSNFDRWTVDSQTGFTALTAVFSHETRLDYTHLKENNTMSLYCQNIKLWDKYRTENQTKK